MKYSYTIRPHELEFIKPALTSRNTFKKRMINVIELTDLATGKSGIGEAAPLHLLSIDDVPEYAEVLDQKLAEFSIHGDLNQLDMRQFPSISFGLETALLDLKSDDQGRMYQSNFTLGKAAIPVNGLVWMSDTDTMYKEALAKIDAGFKVIKFKVGAQDFDAECRMLEKVRNQYSAFKITLRLDANGAFSPDEAMEQLRELKRFEIHSIEQPIASGNWDGMEELCFEKIIPVALDEELIGVDASRYGYQLLNHIKPQYIILKPNLLGGFQEADTWIKYANRLDVQWWATSALESNIGLNAIAQWVSTYNNHLHQGLGTGALFSNNFETQLVLKNGLMSYQAS